MILQQVLSLTAPQYWNSLINYGLVKQPEFTNKKGKQLLISTKVVFANNQVATLLWGVMQNFNYDNTLDLSKKDYGKYLRAIIESKIDTYMNNMIVQIIFSIRVKNEITPQPPKAPVSSSHMYLNFKLPTSCIIKDMGKLITEVLGTYIIKLDGGYICHLRIENKGKEHHAVLLKNNIKVLEWVDTITGDNVFYRQLGHNLFYYKDNVITLRKTTRLFPKIKIKKPETVINDKYIAMDVECYKDINGLLIPYLLCWYSAKENKSYHINDYDNSFSLVVKAAMSDLSNHKYKGFKIYMHNFTFFDGVLLMTELAKIGLRSWSTFNVR